MSERDRGAPRTPLRNHVDAASGDRVAEVGSEIPAAGPPDTTKLYRESAFRRLLGLADAMAITVVLIFGAVVLGGGSLSLAALGVPVAFVALAKTTGLYDRDAQLLHKTTLDELPALFSIASATILLLWLSGGLFAESGFTRPEIATMWPLLLILLLGLRSLARLVALRTTPPERCLFVGDAGGAEQLREELGASRFVRAELVGWIPAGEVSGNGHRWATLAERIRTLVAERNVDRVILGPGPTSSEEVLDSVRQARAEGPRVSVLPELARVVSSSVELDRLNGITLLGVRRFEITHSSRVIKRAFDLAGSAGALLVLSPLLIAVAVAVRLDSRGPVLFRQARAGRHGEAFQMLKFRSMVDGAEAQRAELLHLNQASGVFKIVDDPRVTRVGKIIRRLHVDELPQLLNVLRGEMSLVGPRPLPLEEDRRIVGWHRRRLDLRPGITGPWQVLGSWRIPVSEMVQLDYQYVADWSVWNDIRILLLTVPHVLGRRGH